MSTRWISLFGAWLGRGHGGGWGSTDGGVHRPGRCLTRRSPAIAGAVCVGVSGSWRRFWIVLDKRLQQCGGSRGLGELHVDGEIDIQARPRFDWFLGWVDGRERRTIGVSRMPSLRRSFARHGSMHPPPDMPGI